MFHKNIHSTLFIRHVAGAEMVKDRHTMEVSLLKVLRNLRTKVRNESQRCMRKTVGLVP